MPTGNQKKRTAPKPLPRGRNRLAPDLVLTRQRQRLIDAMRQLVAKHGYNATSVSSVAKLAHVTRPVFYKAFPKGKDECFFVVYDEVVDELLTTGASAYNASGGLSGIEAALRAATIQMARDPASAQISLVEITALGGPGLARRDAVLSQVGDALQRALRAGEPDADISSTKLRALIGGCYQLLYLTVAEGRAHELPALVPDMLYMMLAYGLAPRSPSLSSGGA